MIKIRRKIGIEEWMNERKKETKTHSFLINSTQHMMSPRISYIVASCMHARKRGGRGGPSLGGSQCHFIIHSVQFNSS
jgi:hypothetical protein